MKYQAKVKKKMEADNEVEMQDVDSVAERDDTDMHVDWHAWDAAFICEFADLCFWHATLILSNP